MKSKYFVICTLFLFMLLPQSYAACPIKPDNTITAGYEEQKRTMLPLLQQREYYSYDLYRRKCLVSKIGRGTMIAGSGLVVGGIVYAFTVQGWDGLDGLAVSIIGLLVVFIGGMLAIGGGIYNHSKQSKVSITSPKNNEVGIAYKF